MPERACMEWYIYIIVIAFLSIFSGFREHLWCHINTNYSALRSHSIGREKAIEPCTGSKVKNGLSFF